MGDNIIDFSEITDKDVFTKKGAFCGTLKDIELNMGKFGVRAVVVGAKKGSYLAEKVGGSKNVVIPYHMVEAIDDIVIIKDFQTSDVPQEQSQEA